LTTEKANQTAEIAEKGKHVTVAVSDLGGSLGRLGPAHVTDGGKRGQKLENTRQTVDKTEWDSKSGRKKSKRKQ